ncbi:MAG: type II/IV secretion system protein, partial [Phycisphaerae bacterium]|nr:type II/IV secretion system protein [Phycisphaerae bacterium]
KDQTELAGKLASLLRRDPDVLMIEACGTAQAADLICEASAEKSILLGSVSSSTLATLAKWVKVTGNAAKAMKPLKAITCQTLLRKLCPNCREAYTPQRDMLAKLNLPAEKIDTFYRPPTIPVTDEKGNPIICHTCRGTGYYGRTGVFELLEITDEICELVTQNAPLASIKAACRKNKMLYLQEKALRQVISGVTSIEEVIRVSKQNNG